MEGKEKKGSKLFGKLNQDNQTKEPLIKTNKTIIPNETSNEVENCLNIEDIENGLYDNFKLGNTYIFKDIDQNQLCVIDYESENPFESIKYYHTTNTKDILRTMLIERQKKGLIDSQIDLKKVKSLKTILDCIRGVKKSFDHQKEELYIDSDYIPTLNMFKRTPITLHQVEKKREYKEVVEILKKDYPRLNILLENNIGGEQEIEWFLNWVSMEMNNPRDIKTTFVLIGEQGSGKSLLVEEIFRENIYNFSNVSILDNKTIKDNFNDIYNYKSFVIMNEVSTFDLKESNQISQDIKRLITDSTFMNRGMFKSGVEKRRTFNLCMLSNKGTPIQIENGDRRFSVFGRGKKLLELGTLKQFLKKNNEKFETYVENVKLEIKHFLFILKELEYNNEVSIKPIMTPLKKQIIQNSNTKEDLLKSFITNQDYKSLETLLKKYDTLDTYWFYILEKMFDIGIITNDYLFDIYTHIFDIEVNEYNKSGKQKESGSYWGKILTTPSVPKVKIDNKTYSFKIFNEDNLDTKKEQLKILINGIKNGDIYQRENKNGEIEIVDNTLEEKSPF
jgi:hypothetical protein